MEIKADTKLDQSIIQAITSEKCVCGLQENNQLLVNFLKEYGSQLPQNFKFQQFISSDFDPNKFRKENSAKIKRQVNDDDDIFKEDKDVSFDSVYYLQDSFYKSQTLVNQELEKDKQKEQEWDQEIERKRQQANIKKQSITIDVSKQNNNYTRNQEQPDTKKKEQSQLSQPREKRPKPNYKNKIIISLTKASGVQVDKDFIEFKFQNINAEKEFKDGSFVLTNVQDDCFSKVLETLDEFDIDFRIEKPHM